MREAVDFVVASPDDEVKLVVEAKSRSGASSTWAAQFRRNLVAHGTLRSSAYFILALPDHFYVWKDARLAGTAPPDFEAESQGLLAPYLRSLSTSARDLSEESFEVVVRTWLEDLVRQSPSIDRATETPKWLVELSESVKNGTVKTNA